MPGFGRLQRAGYDEQEDWRRQGPLEVAGEVLGEQGRAGHGPGGRQQPAGQQGAGLGPTRQHQPAVEAGGEAPGLPG